MASNKIEIVRHTYDAMEVVAYDLWGKIVRHRMYRYGTRRKEWAVEQAQRWEDELYLPWDGKIYH